MIWKISEQPIVVHEPLGEAFDAELKSLHEMAQTNGDKLLLACAEELQAERAAGRLQSLPIQPVPKACDEAAQAAADALARALGEMLRGLPSLPPIYIPEQKAI